MTRADRPGGDVNGSEGDASHSAAPAGAVHTSTSRLALLDLMRTVALLRVVLLHITGVDALSLLASIPVIFFVAGALYAKSMERRRGLIVIRDRYRRILPSVIVYAAALTALYASQGLLTSSWSSVTGPDGYITQLGIYDTLVLFLPFLSPESPVGPGNPDQAVFWTWNALWYIHTHLMLALIGPVLVWCYRRWARATLGVLLVVWVLDAVAAAGTSNTITFMVFFTAGFAFTDGVLLEVSRRRLKQFTVVSFLLGLLFLPLGPGMAINTWAPSLLFVGAAWVTGCLAYREVLETVALGRVAQPIIGFVNRRALSIYLWSLMGVYVSRVLFPPEGNLFQLGLIAGISVLISTAVTLVACILLGWIEDLAGRRTPQWWPTPDAAIR